MIRVNRIMEQELFQFHLKENLAAEADRRFCCHNMSHFLDVARIAYILNLEEHMGIDKECIYAAALLHDLGKHRQYRENIPHEQASAEIAPSILKACGFEEEEILQITEAIRSHRDAKVAQERSLRGLLYRGDKASRSCFCCQVEQDCHWKDDKKNLQLRY